MCIGMRNGSFSRYYNVSSIIHSLNPLCKILALMLFIFMAIMASNIREMCCLFIILIFIIGFSNVSIINYFKSIYSVRILLFFVFIISLLFSGSVYNSFIVCCRICLIILYFSVLLFTTTTNGIAYGFSSLFRPLGLFGFPVTRISIIIALGLNFFPSLFLESDRIGKSQVSRGFNYNECSFFDRLKFFISMFICSIRRFNGVNDVMSVRNFGFNVDSSSISSFKWNVNDFYMIFGHMMVFVFVLIKEVVM